MPIQISPFAARTVGEPRTGVPRTELAFSGPLENMYSPTVRKVVHLNASCCLSAFDAAVYDSFKCDTEDAREAEDSRDEEGVLRS